MLKGSVADRILLFEKMPDQIDEPKSQKSPPKEILARIVSSCVDSGYAPENVLYRARLRYYRR